MSNNIVNFKRMKDHQRDGFKEILDMIDFDTEGVMLVIDHEPEDQEGNFKVISNYLTPGMKEVIAMGALNDWLMGQVYGVEEE